MVYDIIVGRNDNDRKKFGEKGTIFIGKQFVKMGQTTSLSNNMFLDIVRPHVVMVSGKRGSGKCLLGDTLITLEDGSVKPIKDLENDNNKILCLNHKLKITSSRKTEFYKRNVKKILHIKLRSGKEIKLTPEHPLLTIKGWKPVEELIIGSRIAAPKKIKIKEITNMSSSNQILLQIKDNKINSLESDIFWDEIVYVEQLEGEFEVYDICVPENHNFIANDIIVHNSYSLSVIAEEMSRLPEEIKNNLAILFFDTMGIFWTMNYPNTRQSHLLEEWDLKPEGMNINIYTPSGYFQQYKEKGIPTNFEFRIKTSELNSGDWCNLFDIKLTDPIGVLIERIIESLQDSSLNYDIEDITRLIMEDKKTSLEIKNAAENRFLAAATWGLFSKKGTEIKDLLKPGQVSVLDISCYTDVAGAWSIKALVIGIISQKLLNERIGIRKYEELYEIKTGEKLFGEEQELEQMPMVWLLIDEAHQFLPREGITPATNALVQLLREGRQPGISLILATQQPGEINRDVLTQSDIVLSHRLTAKVDIEALNSMMQTYLITDIQSYLNTLPRQTGAGIILDDNSERIYPVQIHPKRSWHGGEAPTAIKKEKKLLDLGF